MDSNSYPYYKTYSEFEVVSRNNKKKKRQRKKRFTTSQEINNQPEAGPPVESEGDSNFTDDSVSEQGRDEPPDEGASTSQELTLNIPRNLVYRDAVMNVPPSVIASPEVEKVYEEEKESANLVIQSPELENNVVPLLNSRALTKHAVTYELEKFEKKVLIIFNQENVDRHMKRLGTEQDVKMLNDTFGQFGFEVVEYKDFTRDKILETLKTFTSPTNNLSDYGCVAVAVLTHGSDNGLLRAKDQQFSEIEIINHFKVTNNQTLVTKPKLLIIQACRGTKLVPGVPVFHAGKIRKDVDEAVEPYILPVEADMLILHSSYEGSPSHRNEIHGSWFIQELCKKINLLAATKDLESIMVEVKREVAINKEHEEYNRRTLEMDINKQMPVTTSTLIRKLYLRSYDASSPTVETSADRPRRSISSDIKKDVLDAASVCSPLLNQLGPCSCFLEHFNYMRTCLKYFIDENPQDETAIHMWGVADAIQDDVKFSSCKEQMTKAISNYLYNNAKASEYYKYLYFCKRSAN